MATPGVTDATRLSDADIAEVLRLLRGADSVELKVTVPAGEHRTAIRELPLDPVDAQPRQAYFFDTPDLALDAAGLVVRARRIQGGRGDTVVKLRPAVPEEITPELRKSAGFAVEVDALPGGFVCSASFKGKSTGLEIREAVAGTTPIRKLFSREQRAYYEAHAPAGIALDGLTPLGPIFLLKAMFPLALSQVAGANERRVVAEMWLYPDGARILELSTKCLPSEAFQVAAEMRSYLGVRGIPIVAGQATKTRAALDFFKAELAASAG